jgi:hypothetical protein
VMTLEGLDLLDDDREVRFGNQLQP